MNWLFYLKNIKPKRLFWFVAILFIFIIIFNSLIHFPLFDDKYSTVLFDKEGYMLGAKISKDGQWRFQENLKVPEKFKIAITNYEDQYFWYHPGFNPVSLFRALYLDIKNGKFVSGGSTITMQVIRLSEKNSKRTILNKVKEIIIAFRLEMSLSKNEILGLYASHAPFGGNVVGLDAASWRYFNNNSGNLSWAEAATLAVLPNSPSLIYPGKNQHLLLIKRNKLLDKLFQKKFIDKTTCELAKCENLPQKPFPLAQKAHHLTERLALENQKGENIYSTLDKNIQEKVNEILEVQYPKLSANGIHNIAALVLKVNSGEVLAYVGNVLFDNNSEQGNKVDIITSPRSTGSILKPFLYAAMLNDGLLLPTTLVPDIPMQIGNFMPENFSMTFDGAVPAKMALARSLNIPAVKMLQSYGVSQFYSLLKKIGISTLSKPADHYGLSLILGGAEANLWDLAAIYASLGRTLNNFNKYHKYNKNDFHQPIIINTYKPEISEYTENYSWFDAASIWLMFEAMNEVSRPDEEFYWKQFSSSSKIAWKTGTSFGNRDAWSIGINPEYVVAVWVGNASGEGRPGLTGISCAAPILFNIFKLLKPTGWFAQPFSEMEKVAVCHKSGFRVSTICEQADTIWIQKKGLKTAECPYHQLVHLDKTEKWQVNSNCESTSEMRTKSWFILPPIQEWYYKNKNPFYKVLPPFRKDCNTNIVTHSMDMIYPQNNSRIYIPDDFDGNTQKIICKSAHRNPNISIFWHLDNNFIGVTNSYHQMALSPEYGIHFLTLVDENGESITIKFEVLNKK